MKFVYIILERIKSHFKNHKTVMAMFLLGVLASSIFFAYFYGEIVLELLPTAKRVRFISLPDSTKAVNLFTRNR